MAKEYVPISGLWSRKTSRGEVLSAALNPATRQKLVAALLDESKQYELTIFVNDRADKPTSPSHNLVLTVQNPRLAVEASPEPRATTAEERLFAGKAFQGQARPKVDDGIPF